MKRVEGIMCSRREKKSWKKKIKVRNKKNADSPGELANFCFERGIAEFGKMIENGGLFWRLGIQNPKLRLLRM